MDSTGAFDISRSNMYQFWLAQRAEIDKLKWCMSEKAGHDVGLDAARWRWDTCHRAAWISGLKASGLYPT